jgi:hypothetical protein
MPAAVLSRPDITLVLDRNPKAATGSVERHVNSARLVPRAVSRALRCVLPQIARNQARVTYERAGWDRL